MANGRSMMRLLSKWTVHGTVTSAKFEVFVIA